MAYPISTRTADNMSASIRVSVAKCEHAGRVRLSVHNADGFIIAPVRLTQAETLALIAALQSTLDEVQEAYGRGV
jgi:hypothetical protein